MTTGGRGPTIAVLGGGISGLAAAWEVAMRSSGAAVVVLEASADTGGLIASIEIGGRLVDAGADAFIARRPEAVGLCEELGIADMLAPPSASGASVWARGRLRALPEGLALGVPTRLGPLARSGICSAAGLSRAAADLVGLPPRDKHDASRDRAVGEVVRRHLGAEVVDRLAGPLVGGIHAGRTDAMSAAAVFPGLLAADRAGGSLMRRLRPRPDPSTSPAPPVFLAPPGGMHTLPPLLTARLRDAGADVRCGATVRTLARTGSDWTLEVDGDASDAFLHADGVVVALPPAGAATLLLGVDEALAELVNVRSASVAIVTMTFTSPVALPAGTGFLVPAESGRLTTACTFLTQKWAHLARPGEVVLRASAGRDGDVRATSLDDRQLADRVVSEVRTMLGALPEPRETVVRRWPSSFPQYDVGHPQRVEEIREAAARQPGLALAGSALDGVGIPACIGSGRRAARDVLAALDGSRVAHRA